MDITHRSKMCAHVLIGTNVHTRIREHVYSVNQIKKMLIVFGRKKTQLGIEFPLERMYSICSFDTVRSIIIHIIYLS
jgi:hypothetical protein